VQRDARVPLGERPHDRRHEVVRDRGEEADAQLALLPPRRPADRVDRALRLRQHRPRFPQQHGADVGELHAAGAALEQRRPELGLQRADLLREPRAKPQAVTSEARQWIAARCGAARRRA